jgi:hypothetical protein
MKKYIFIFLALWVFLVACESKPQDIIVKKWKLDTENFRKSTEEQVEKLKKESPDQMEKVETNLAFLESVTNVVFEFRQDGSVEIVGMGQTQKGQWKLNEDTKTLEMSFPNKKQEIQIVEFSKSKMVLKLNEKTLLPLVAVP